MPIELTSLSDLAALPYDDIIDVRSPAEYATDHIPTALSLPALFNEERARVGTIYVQDDPFAARKIGAALVSRNVAAHLEGPLADKPGGWRPLVYCWRGGQRSGSVAIILKQIGWRADTITGGYQSYRRLVARALYDDPMPCPVILIDGGTGTAKTRLLDHLASQGAQTLDLEAMAEHRGSLFGPMSLNQPAQKAFESRLAMSMATLNPAKPVYVEAESSKIGRIIIPPTLWQAMRTAPTHRLNAPLSARAEHLLTAYPDMIENRDKLDATLSQLTRYHGHEQINAWRDLSATGAFSTLAQQLIQTHYDPRYARISRASVLHNHDLPDLSDRTLSAAAAQIINSK
ncbi:tRNA 2-selenouridine(34) synthase MnmH [Shimia abyssi]|uniref:tRNA 2-selenouridine synthase n=1 Tax=Shimia abyssi TaxID=1662395 RepID=A0A2P8FJX0_9RHOB|nr:tRNA 2-selenouridine(34) synthase MnmH [Shimia abyssi]PSL22021.1 tRNA 2-selenouridine synthase [Shimia abyssi]